MENLTSNSIPESNFLTVAQAAARMGTSEAVVRQLCNKGWLSGAVQDYERGPWQIPAESVEAWVRENKQLPTLWQRIVSVPLWQRTLAIVATLGVIAALVADSADIFDRVQQVIATPASTVIATVPSPTGTFTPIPTVTPLPTATPLAFATGASTETLILIATFHNTAVNNAEVHRKIQRAIEIEKVNQNEQYLRVEVEPTELITSQRTEAEALGKQYNASMVIWGEDTGVEVIVNFLNIKQPNFRAAAVTIIETERTQLANPQAYASFVTKDLPQQITFFSLFAIGQSYHQNENYPLAIKQIEAAVGQVPPMSSVTDLADAYFILGWLYQLSVPTNLEKAIANYNQAIELDPNYAKAYNNRGIAYREQGEWAAAITDYTKAIELDPNRTLAYYNRGIAYSNQGKLAAAIADFNKAIELDPNYAATYNNRGIAYSNQGKLAAAIADFNKAIELDPNYATAYNNRGNAYREQGEWAAAITDYTKAIELDPNDAATYYNRGYAYKEQDEWAAALADYTKAIELDPNLAIAYSSRGNAHLAQGEWGAAIADYTKVIELDPNYAKAYYNRGLAYRAQGELTAAIADYTKAIELDPNDAAAYNNRGYAYREQGELIAAIADYTKVIELDPNLALVYKNRGIVYIDQGEWAAAIADFRYYLELQPNTVDRFQIEQTITELEAELAKQK